MCPDDMAKYRQLSIDGVEATRVLPVMDDLLGSNALGSAATEASREVTDSSVPAGS